MPFIVDKYELLVQCIEYEKNNKTDLKEFLWVKEAIKGDLVKGWAEDVIKEREQYMKSTSQLPTDGVSS